MRFAFLLVIFAGSCGADGKLRSLSHEQSLVTPQENEIVPGERILKKKKSPGRLLVANTLTNNIVEFSQRKGKFIRELIPPGSGGIVWPDVIIEGPDGLLYISAGTTEEESGIFRFDPDTGDFIDKFASGGGLIRPYGMIFSPDGNILYVSSFNSDELLRYDGKTGEFIDVFAKGDQMPGGLNGPDSLIFGQDGMLYVTTQGSVTVDGELTYPGLPSQVLRYDIKTKKSEVFASPEAVPGGQGYVSLLGIEFTPDCERKGMKAPSCDLFVSDFAGGIRRYSIEGVLEAVYPTTYIPEAPNSNGGISFGSGGNLFTVGFDESDESKIGTLMRFKWRKNMPAPAPGNDFAILSGPAKQLSRPVGILALP